MPTPAGWSRVCPQGHEEFPRTDPAVIVLVHDGADSIVLARQPIWPPGRMSVLAGFVEAGESLEGTVVREVLEEVGVHVTDVSYLGLPALAVPAVADGRIRGQGRAGRRAASAGR